MTLSKDVKRKVKSMDLGLKGKIALVTGASEGIAGHRAEVGRRRRAGGHLRPHRLQAAGNRRRNYPRHGHGDRADSG